MRASQAPALKHRPSTAICGALAPMPWNEHRAGSDCCKTQRHGRFGISIITDLGVEGHTQKVTHEEVQQVANKQEPKLTFIVKELISKVKFN